MGLSVATKMLQIAGRILDSPIPTYSRGSDSSGPSTGSWNLRGKRFHDPSGIATWGVMYFPAGRNRVEEHQLLSFCKELANGLSAVGMKAPQGPPRILPGNPQASIKSQVEDLIKVVGKRLDKKPDLLIFFLHSTSGTSLYRAIKNVCEVHFGITSQVMLIEKAILGRGSKAQYCGNIALKLNAKRGGVNSIVPETLYQKRRWMMLGGKPSSVQFPCLRGSRCCR